MAGKQRLVDAPFFYRPTEHVPTGVGNGYHSRAHVAPYNPRRAALHALALLIVELRGNGTESRHTSEHVALARSWLARAGDEL